MNSPSPQSLPTRVADSITSKFQTLVDLRRELHRYPELSHQEFETTKRIANRLRTLGYEVHIRPEGTGLFADIARQDFDPDLHPTVAIRSDIDALPIDELNHVPYKSCHQGVMHACGHDAHMATVFGSALALAKFRDELPGRVRLIYQHAEESTPSGAAQMIDFGALEGVNAVLGLHCDPELPLGKIGVRPGPFTAACDLFEFTIIGKGGHGARPHQCVDPIYVATQLCNALYNFIGRTFDSRIPAALSIGTIQGGHVPNVIPEKVRLAGTVRTIDRDQRNALKEHLHRIATSICMIHGAQYELYIELGAPAVRNHPGITDLYAEIGAELLGTDNIYHIPLPSMGGEDFSFYCEHVPAAMFRLGTARQAPDPLLHTPTFDIDERAMEVGAKILARTALRLLNEFAENSL